MTFDWSQISLSSTNLTDASRKPKHKATILTLIAVCGFPLYHQAVLPYQLGVLQYNSGLIQSTSPGDSIRSHRWRAPSYKTAPPQSPSDANQIPHHLGFCPTCYRSTVPKTRSWGSINSEWLTELRATFDLLDYQFVTEGCNSGVDRWNRCIEQGVGKGHRASMSYQSMPHSPVSTYLPTSSPSPSLDVQGWNWPSNHRVGSPGD